MTNVLCVIPAKGNSRRLKNKNGVLLGKKILVQYTVDAAIESHCFSKIILSSNDDNILNNVIDHDLLEKHKRPDYLCEDNIRAKDVVKYYLEQDNTYTHVALLMPTTPFRNQKDIKNAFDITYNKDADTLVSVCEFEFNPWLAIKVQDNKGIPYFSENLQWDREDKYSKGYHLNGGIYIAKMEYFLKHETFFDDTSYVYIMPRIRSIDIDTEEDFELATMLLNKGNE